MKFGDTLYRRSVPEWAAYNVNYNEIKRLIKQRTTNGVAAPVSIPSASSNNRWSGLEEELFDTIQDQHDNVVLFLKSKYGELNRRLSFLEKQVKSAQRTADLPYSNPTLQSRRYRKLLEDADSIGQDIQNLTRFASVQKTAFRKVLKKYRKWTGSTSLQERLENDLFSTGQLNFDYVHLLERLATQKKIVVERIQGPTTQDKPEPPSGDVESPSQMSNSTVVGINSAVEKGPMSFDAALATIPFAQSSGSAVYWIHSDNVDEAEALLLGHVDEVYRPTSLSRQNSGLSIESGQSRGESTSSDIGSTHVAYFDDVQRLSYDTSSNRPSKVALSGRWCLAAQAVVTMSNLSPRDPSGSMVRLKRKELASALSQDVDRAQLGRRPAVQSSKVRRIQEYVSEHPNLRPLAQVRSSRARYVGSSNSTQAGVWATLDRDVVFSACDNNHLGFVDTGLQGEVLFPHAILEIRWEAVHGPEAVRAFNATHLAEKVENFTLESAAISAVNEGLPPPSWNTLLEKDIRKVPATLKTSVNRGSVPRGRTENTGVSSGASSDGPTESVFSSRQIHSSATSDVSPEASTREPLPTALKSASRLPDRKKKRARIDAESPPPRQSRYWNEFDDGDEDVNAQEAYTIYIDPDQSFPGVETVSKAFGAMCQSLYDAKSRISSMLSMGPPRKSSKKDKPNERTRLLGPSSTSNSDIDADSSDSDTTPTQETSSLKFGAVPRPKLPAHTRAQLMRSASTSTYRPNQVLTPRQEALERTYLYFYSGLLTLAYILLFVSGVLLYTGRKKALLEVDFAVVAGLTTAEVCGIMSLILICMRKQILGAVHWGIVGVAFTGIVLVGVAEVVGIIGRTA